MKRIQDMGLEEIVDHLIEDRGLSVKDKRLRAEYDLTLVSKARDGDIRALTALLRIGSHFSRPRSIKSG